MNIVTPILSPRVQNYGNADHFPTISGPRVFSPLRSIQPRKKFKLKFWIIIFFISTVLFNWFKILIIDNRDLSTSSFNRNKLSFEYW